MGIHLVFFLHVTTGPDNTNNVMALAFGVLIVVLVVVGSLLIMADLNDSMMPAAGADEHADAALKVARLRINVACARTTNRSHIRPSVGNDTRR